MEKKIVYISYDGLTDPLGESQVLSYITYNAKHRQFAIYSFEKPERNEDVPRISKICKKNGITWHPLKYTKKPPILSTLKDIIVGYRAIKKNENNKEIICHARSYMGGLIALSLKKRRNIPYIFDMRGWWIDERIENGQFSKTIFKPVIKYMRRKERQLISQASEIISLTHCAEEVLIKEFNVEPNKITVIPTCVNFSYFYFDGDERVRIREKLGIPKDSYVLIYNGSIGGYYNVDEMLKVFYNIKASKSNAVFLFVTKQEPEIVLSKVPEKNRKDIFFASCKLNEMYKYLSAADLGLILYNNTFSSTGRSPTKLAEYWSVGIPVICPKGVGDLDLFFKDDIGGLQFVLEDNNSYRSTVNKILSNSYDRNQIVKKAREYFDSEVGAEKYNEVYLKIDQSFLHQ